MHRDGQADRRWLVALGALVTALIFALLHPYRGLVHDARLYTIQALGHWQPGLYGTDIFLRLGSQDDYTIYSTLHAVAISWFGVEPAAAVLTGIAVLLFLASFVVLAARCMPKEQVAAALILVLVLPGYYGSARVFHFLEEFVTPRQLAEALSLFGVAAWISRRKVTGLALCVGAMLVHPIIGLPGLLMIPVLEWILPLWRRLIPFAIPALMVTGLLTMAASVGWLPVSRWQFDEQWHAIVMNRGYLGMSNWTNEDWGRVLTVLATLVTASISLTGRQQSIAWATTLVVAALMTLALVGGEVLRITLIVQAQPWRAMWLGTCIAILLMAPLYAKGWKSGPVMQCALWLIAAAWAAPHGVLALVAAPLGTLAAAFSSRAIPVRTATLILWGGRATFIIAVLHSVAVSWLAWNEGLAVLPDLPPVMQKISLFGESGVVPALAIAAVYWIVIRFRSLPLVKVMTGILAVAVLTVAYPAGRTWTTTKYDGALFDAFETWRAVIPPGSEVLWVGSEPESAAIHTWLLLQRPTYISITQAPNALFSRAAATEMARRAELVARLLPFSNPFNARRKSKREGQFTLEPICSSMQVRYIVTHVQLADAMPLPAPEAAPPTLRDHGLYICP